MNDFQHIKPPKWPLKFLRFFLKREYLEEIEGDMEEVFQEELERSSIQRARRLYAWETLKLLHPVLIRNLKEIQLYQFAMFRNYFRTSVRNLLKNPASSFINVFGLAVAIGVCIVVYTFLDMDSSIDQFHARKNEVFLVTAYAHTDGSLQQYGVTPRPLGEMMKDDLPGVKNVCRVIDGNVVIKQSDNVFHENIRYVDPEFLQMFTFPLKWGTSNTLADLNSIILSEDMSVKYFGDENPVGRDLLIVYDDGRSKAFTVTGVAATFPKAHAIEFSFLVNFDNIKVADLNYQAQDWNKIVAATLIEVHQSSDITVIQNSMAKYQSLQNEAVHDRKISAFEFVSLADLHSRSANIKKCISFDDNVEGRIGMPIIALFMLALACFNYINIAIVSAAKRLKEIAVRKVIGAHRVRVIIQFLTENVVTTFFALIVGGLLGAFIFLPWFVQFSGWQLEIKLWDGKFWLFLIGLMFITGVVSGAYPAFYISKFEAVKIFRGSLQFGKKNPLTKTFLAIQLVLACMTISAAVVFTQNNRFQYSQEWGYHQKGALYVSVPDHSAYEKMNAVMDANHNITRLSGSTHHIGKSRDVKVVHMSDDERYEVRNLAVDAGYLETLGVTLVQGRVFTKDAVSDKKPIVVNETLVKNFSLDKPVGTLLEIDSMKYEVIGVVKDFHSESFFNKIEPTIFTVADENAYHYLSMRVQEGKEAETLADLQKQWIKFYPEIPFQGGYQEDVWGAYFFYVDRSQAFNIVIACIAVLLASLGLYGLVTLNISGRVREFSIRKTLGADIRNITSSILKQYLPLTVVAMALGAPISFMFTNAYLHMLFAYPMPMGYSGIIISIFVLVLVLLVVISTQIKKVLQLNPVDGLKIE